MHNTLELSKDQCSRLESLLKRIFANRYQVISVNSASQTISFQIFSGSLRNLLRNRRLSIKNIETDRSVGILQFLLGELPKAMTNVENTYAIGRIKNETSPMHQSSIGSKLGTQSFDDIFEYCNNILNKVFENIEEITYSKDQIEYLWISDILFPTTITVRHGSRAFKFVEEKSQ